MNTIPTVRTFTTFTFLGGVVALAVASVVSWGNLFAAPPLAAGDDPLANHLAIVEPRSQTLEAAHRAAKPEAAVTLTSWEFTDSNPTRFH